MGNHLALVFDTDNMEADEDIVGPAGMESDWVYPRQIRPGHVLLSGDNQSGHLDSRCCLSVIVTAHSAQS